MGKKVYANGNAIACKAGGGKVVAAFPDVCMSPPGPPAGPAPVPYPNSSFSKDTKQGSKRVKIGGKPICVGKRSHFATSPLGDEAATKSFGGSSLSHTITGKTQFSAHSMDVKVEGEYVCRHLDLTTSNHASYPGSTPPYPDMEDMSMVAQERIAEQRCPCCGKQECAAAFSEDDEPISMEDFYGLNETGPDGELTAEAADRMTTYRRLLALKERHCTCEGIVFPQAPCDVFRPPNPDRTSRIRNKWNGRRGKNKSDYRNRYLADHPSAISNFTAMNPDSTAPSSGKRFDQVNHLTPKGGGGCPDNDGNLQPHDLLCNTCKEIDNHFGKWQRNDDRWRNFWAQALQKLDIHPHQLDNFHPHWW